MVGGIIVETRTIHSGKVWVNVEERPRNGSHAPEVCAIYVNPSMPSALGAWQLRRGDAIWWQGEYAYWTPKDHGQTVDDQAVDIPLKRIGFSGVKRPEYRA